jgi:hypothetical protein
MGWCPSGCCAILDVAHTLFVHKCCKLAHRRLHSFAGIPNTIFTQGANQECVDDYCTLGHLIAFSHVHGAYPILRVYHPFLFTR